MPTPLTQSFFARDTLSVARDLVGCRLLATGYDGEEVSGRVVEVEAYGGLDDPASHAGRGRTPRSEIMFGPAGYAYVYFIYGMHHCLNFVTESEGTAGAVLIRALEPMAGREIMAGRRGRDPVQAKDRELCGGPGRLCQALGIDLDWNGMPVAADLPDLICENGGRSLSLFPGPGPVGGVEATPRIGIRQAIDRRWRFVDPACNCFDF